MKKKSLLRPSNPSTLTEAIIEFDVEPDEFIGVDDRPDLVSLYVGIPNLPAGHKIKIKAYEYVEPEVYNLKDEEEFETAKVPMGFIDLKFKNL